MVVNVRYWRKAEIADPAEDQNPEKPRQDKTGKQWNFLVWASYRVSERAQRIFFWDDARAECGVMLLIGKQQTVHVRRLNKLIDKLAADPEFRKQHSRDLRFPIKRHYRDYGAFPEEGPQP